MLPYSEACERNRGPILEVLREAFADRRRVVELGAGTGQHAVHFARNLRHLSWQPTDRGEYLDGLAARIAAEGPMLSMANLRTFLLGDSAILFKMNPGTMQWSGLRQLLI